MIHAGGYNLETFTITACDNGFIINMRIPFTERNPTLDMMDQMTDKIIKAQKEIAGEEWKPEEEEKEYIPVPVQKSDYTFVCKDEKEAMEKIAEFFKMTKK